MEKCNAKDWIKKGDEFYNSENLDEAIKCYNEVTQLYNCALAFLYCGTAKYELGQERQDETLLIEACEKFEKATEIKKCPIVYNNWGAAIYGLAKIRQDETLFEEAIEKYSESIRLKPDDNYAYCNKGQILYQLYKTKKEESFLIEKAKYFIQSQKDILLILVLLKEEDIEQIIQTKILHPILDSDTNDGRFFKEKTKSIKDEKELDKYKDIYILSNFIISLLHVTDKNEKLVAHYTKKIVLQKMLLGGSKFRLNAINYSNDPTEGKTLLDYLFGEECPAKEKLNAGYCAFAGCFTFNHDSLNQFRLYGKEDDKEGTGVSIVFRKRFFHEEAKMALAQEISDEAIEKKEETTHALFHCIYVDPDTKRVETIGHKETYLFYREDEKNTDKKVNEYNAYITDVTKKIREKMEELKRLVQEVIKDDNDKTIIGQLLINLRYLTKHIAFKEEQECRTVKIYRLNNEEKVKTTDDFNQMYVEYDLPVRDYIDKIYFGTKVSGIELFQNIMTHNNIHIPYEKSKNPLA